MKVRCTFGILVAVGLMSLAPALAQPDKSKKPEQEVGKEAVDPAVTAKAHAVKQDMQKTLPPGIQKKLGFGSTEELANATLGDPHKVYMFRLDDLKAFKAGDDPKKILGRTNEILYPILVDGNVTSAIGFRHEKGDWIPTSLGRTQELKIAEPVREKHGKAKGRGHSSYFIARVPSMYMSFLGYWEKNNYFLIPIVKNPALPELEPGKELPAEKALLALQSKAEMYEGLLKERPKETQ
jgi:hypothetical protein